MGTPQDEYTDWMQAAADAGQTRAGTAGILAALALLVMLAVLLA